LDLNEENSELLNLLSTENALIDKTNEFKADFTGVREEVAPRWASVESLRTDISGYSSGKFSTNLDLD
jgi:hypothetical protein